MQRGEWLGWLDKNFHLSQQTATIYMNIARTETFSSTKSLGDFVRQTSNPNYNKPHTVRPMPWHDDVKHAAPSGPLSTG